MAARDRNLYAWQAYVIVVSIVSVALAVALGFYIVNAGTQSKTTQEALTRANSADSKAAETLRQMDLVKGMLGLRQFSEADWNNMKSSISANPDTDAMQKQYEKDMSLFGPAEPIQNKNYPKLAEYLMRELRSRNAAVDANAKREQDLMAKTDNTVRSETAAREKAQEKSAQLEKDLAEARASFKKTIDEGVAEVSRIKDEQQKSQEVAKKEKAKLEATIKTITTDRDQLIKRNLQLANRIEELLREDFQAPQGKIVDVAEGGQIVWVNLGRGDQLRPGVRFGIIDPDTTRLVDAKPKGHIEITEVMDNHQARGRVLTGALTTPILRGDLIYSPTWEKGRKVKFALMGKLDIDGDGIDDRATLRSMIIQSGGEISEDLTPDGKVTGKMTTDTRWLVVGEQFKVGASEDADSKQKDYRGKYADMQQRARSLAVSQINLDKLLSWIRSGGEDRSVPMGSSIRASDFIDNRIAPVSNGSVSEIYGKSRNLGPFAPSGASTAPPR